MTHFVKNPYLDKMHRIKIPLTDEKVMFGHVKFVCIGEDPVKMETMAFYLKHYLDQIHFLGLKTCHAVKSSRYSLFKVGPVLCIGKGTESPSISVVLCEAMNLMRRAGARNPTFLLLGSCGGFAIPTGSVVVTNGCVNGLLQPFQEMIINKEKMECANHLDPSVYNGLKKIALKYVDTRSVVFGKSICEYEFLQGNGRAIGTVHNYSHKHKVTYLRRLRNANVVCTDMESMSFVAMCCKNGFKAGVLNVTKFDYFNEDSVRISKVFQESWYNQMLYVAAMYIKERLEGTV